MSLPDGVERREIAPPALAAVPAPDAKPPSIHEEMLASVERTGITTDKVRIPLVSKEDLHAANDRVQRTYGERARSLTIVGPDVVAIGGVSGVIRLERKRGAELLGSVIAARAIRPTAAYYEDGFLHGYTAGHHRTVAAAQAREYLSTILVDADGKSLIQSRGVKSSFEFGMDDVVVRDLRHTAPYQQARELRTARLIEDYIHNGGPLPSLIEPAMLRAAGKVLSTIVTHQEATGKIKRPYQEVRLTAAQKERHKEISGLRAALLGSRTEAYNEQFNFSDSAAAERRYLRSALSDRLEPRWQEQGLCRGSEKANLFFPPNTKKPERKKDRVAREAKAKEICKRCPSFEPCLEFGLTTELQSKAIYGGMNKQERKTLLIKRRGQS